MSSARKPKRRCKVCDKPERTRSIGGIRLTNIPQYLGACADCIKESSVYRKLVGSLQASPTRKIRPSSTNNPPMSTIVLKFNPSGLGECLYTELIDLSSIGSLDVRRATTVEFNREKQEWEVRDLNNALLFTNKSRAVCLAWEQQHFNH